MDVKGPEPLEQTLYFLYNLLLLLFLPFAFGILSWRWVVQPSYRKGIWERFGIHPKDIGKKEKGERLFWIHAVSVGEVLASVPLIHAIRKKFPKDRLILSTVTVTGQEIALQKIPEVDRMIYCPFDFPWAVQRVVEILRPNLFIFLETELWPNLLRCLKKKGVASLMVNGRISPGSFRNYRWARVFFRRVLGQVSTFSVQTERDARFLQELGADPLTIECMGNMKYDQSFKVFGEDELNSLRQNLGIEKKTMVFVVGSTHEKEEASLLDQFGEMVSRWGSFVMILAPRHLDRLPSIETLLEQRKIPYFRKTDLLALRRKGDPGLGKTGVILLDTLGELSSYYRLATVVFVGGSLVPIGGHNILEPAAYGKFSYFGPYMHNFSEISCLMKERGGGVEVENVKELVEKIETILKKPAELERRGREAFKVVEENRGAVEKNMKLIEKFITP
ncbi:MAG TPA: 3-deoxy-D-manno-octulosonic acid transferase [Nitrospiria bacterium]|jgi:3-deoxy-D-manno-octulosonic-acid transferase